MYLIILFLILIVLVVKKPLEEFTITNIADQRRYRSLIIALESISNDNRLNETVGPVNNRTDVISNKFIDLMNTWLINQINTTYIETENQNYYGKFVIENIENISHSISTTNNKFHVIEKKYTITRDYDNNLYVIYAKIIADRLILKYYIDELYLDEVNVGSKLILSSSQQHRNIDINLNGRCYIKDSEAPPPANFKRAFSKHDCESADSNGIVGVWDKPCRFDEECPYYKANKNYPNNRGGCLNGKCELPVNMIHVGYKNFLTNYKPLCYNCNRNNCSGVNCYTCCDEQAENLNEKLKSPDYVFKKDFYKRLPYKELFRKNNLKLYN